MIHYYLNTAFRSLLREKRVSFLNIIGLSIALASAILIMMVVQTELSYDRSFEDADNIYRVTLHKHHDGLEEYKLATNYNAVAKVLKENFAEIAASGRAFPTYTVGNCFFSVKRESAIVRYEEKNFFHADQGFLDVFSHQTLMGDVSTALNEPFTAVLTRSSANRYFGEVWHTKSIIGENLHLNFVDGEHNYRITAIIEDPPTHSHLDFTILLSMRTYDQLYPDENFDDSWTWWDTYTYVRLRDGTLPEDLEKKFPAILQQYKQQLGYTNEVKDQLLLQPLTAIHLHSDLKHEAKVNGSVKVIYFLLLIGIIVLVSAWANYVNLTTAKDLLKIKALGVHRIIGATKSQVTLQLVFRSLVTFFISVILALVMVWSVKPSASLLLGSSLDFSWHINTHNWITFFLFYFVCSVLAILYTAYLPTSFTPVNAIKRISWPAGSGGRVRNAFLIIQLSLTILLVIATTVIFFQYRYMQSRVLGMDIEQAIVIPTPRVNFTIGTEKYASGVNAFKKE